MRISVVGLVAVIEEVSPFWGEPLVLLPVLLLPVLVVCACAPKLAAVSRNALTNNTFFITYVEFR